MTAHRATRHLILALAAAIILRFVALAVPIDPYQANDSQSFVRLMNALLEEGRLAYEDPGVAGVELRAFRSFFYPIFLAGAKWAHLGLLGALVIQALLGVVVVACAFRVGRDILGPEFGALAAWIGALYFGSIFYERQVLTESLYTSILAIGVTLTLLAFRESSRIGRRDYLSALVAGLVLGMAAITRPVGLPTILAIAGVLLVFKVLETRAVGGGSKAAAPLAMVLLLVVGSAFLVGPVMGRSQVLLGKPVMLTSGGMNFWMGNVGNMSEAWRIMREELALRGEIGMDEWFYADTWGHRGELFAEAPRLLARKCLGIFSPTSRAIREWPHRLILPFAFFGLLLARPKRWLPWMVVWAVIFAHVAVGLLSVADSRYRTPIDPFTWVLASAGLILLWRKGIPGRAVVVGLTGVNLIVGLFLQ